MLSVSSARSNGFSSNPFSPVNDPLANLYPNASSGLEKNGSASDAYRQEPGMGAHTDSWLSNAIPKNKDQDVSFLTQDSSHHSSGSSGRSKAAEFDWLYADMAKHYGMSKETGYAEAMENTSYQRAVKDMKDAGLNPAVLFGSHAGDAAGTPGYIKSASSGGGGSGGSGGGYSGRSYASGYKLSKSQYGAFSGAGAVIGGLAGLISTKSASGAAAGASVGATIGNSIAKILNVF